MRNLKAILVAAAVALSLSACASQSGTEAFNAAFDSQPVVCKPLADGAAAKAVQVTGDFGSKPKVVVPAGVSSKAFESHQAIVGTGPVVHGNEQVVLEYTLLNATTGAVLQATKYDSSTPATLHLAADPATAAASAGPNYCDALVNAHVGSRVVYYMPALLVHQGKGIPSLKVGPKDSLIFIFDVKSVALPRATGAAQTAQNGFPAVVTDKDGVPGVVLPHTAAPSLKTTKVETLIKGAGPVIKVGDNIIVHYSGMVWADGVQSVFDSSWQKEGQAPFGTVLNEKAVIKGWVKAIAGQTVGSQIVAVIPPSEGYGADASNPAIPANSTLVFVVDILGKA